MRPLLDAILADLIPPAFVIPGNHNRRDVLLNAFAGKNCMILYAIKIRRMKRYAVTVAWFYAACVILNSRCLRSEVRRHQCGAR
jgi:hypothetical protein